jgi:hypothetical protein
MGAVALKQGSETSTVFTDVISAKDLLYDSKIVSAMTD